MILTSLPRIDGLRSEHLAIATKLVMVPWVPESLNVTQSSLANCRQTHGLEYAHKLIYITDNSTRVEGLLAQANDNTHIFLKSNNKYASAWKAIIPAPTISTTPSGSHLLQQSHGVEEASRTQCFANQT